MRSKVGGCLFKLCKAIEYQVDDGPVDAVTQESKFSLAEERLLRVKVDPQPLVVGHLIKYSRESFYMRPHHILFMRCICIYFSQECYHRGHRAGILRSCKLQIDRLRYNLSSEVQGNESSLQEQTVLIHSFARPIWTQWDRVNQLWWWFKKKSNYSTDAISGLLVAGRENGVILKDEDSTSLRSHEWVQLNTLKHLGIKTGSTLLLTFQQKNHFEHDNAAVWRSHGECDLIDR